MPAPREGQARTPSIASTGVVSELLAWLGQWVGGEGLQSFWAAAGPAIDPEGEPAPPSDPNPGGGGATTQGGGTMDSDG